MTKKNKIKKVEELTPETVMKYEIAQELGLFEKVQELGWGELTAKETGKIGGLLAVRKKRRQKGQ